MTYRDEPRALRAKVAQLEAELAASKDELRRYREGQLPVAAKVHWLWGGPTVLTLEREVVGEIDEHGFAQLIGVLRVSLGELGRSDQSAHELTWSSTDRGTRLVDATCKVSSGCTQIRLHQQLRPVAHAVFKGVVGFVGIGGLLAVVPMALRLGVVLSPFVLLSWMAAVTLLARWLYGRVSRRHTVQLRVLLDAMA